MDADNIRAVAALALAIAMMFIAFFLGGRDFKDGPREEGRSNKVLEMSFDAFIIAILFIMTFVPNVGFLNLGPFSLTLLHLPVLLGASLFGWKKGALYGLIFGLLSWIKALTAANNAFDIAFAKIYVSVPPRFLFGLLAGIGFSLGKKLTKGRKKRAYLIIVPPVATCLHTIMTIGMVTLCEDWASGWLFSSEPAIVGTGITVLGFLSLAMLLEASLATILTPTLNLALTKAVPSLRIKRA